MGGGFLHARKKERLYMRELWFACSCLLAILVACPAHAQSGKPLHYLDPARDLSILTKPPVTALPEQFIWTRGDAAALNPAYQAKVRGQDDKTVPHYFRARFNVASIPHEATLYVAGPRSAIVFLNGAKVLEFGDDAGSGKGFHVMTANVVRALRQGENVIAIQEIRGHSSLHTGASPVINQVTYGEVLAVKVVPVGIAQDAAPLVASDASWRSTLDPVKDWSSAAFDDSSWPEVQTLGALGSRSDFLQWNADAGLYAWPGYSGITSSMRTFSVAPVAVRDVTGESAFNHPEALLGPAPGALVVSVTAGAPAALTLDFGKELSGRVHLVSASDQPVTVATSYGESAEEALNHPYLGSRSITVPARGEVFGPKSGFRYVRLVFPAQTRSTWNKIDVQGITYPVEYKGSFESSDPLVNRIWETGAYTAHLCMQEGIWDGIKRDRGRWMGDLDVIGRVVNAVFGERDLMESTMTAIIGDSPVQRPINTIAGYSPSWITGQAEFYRHTGDIDYLRAQHQRLLELLHVMDSDLDSTGLFTNPQRRKIFVDWSSGFNVETPEARAATHFEYAVGYKEAAYLFTELGDKANAATYAARENELRSAAQAHLLDASTTTFGTRWQTNAMAVLSGAATRAQQQTIWTGVLSHVLKPSGPDTVVTPYYGYYVLSAMAALNHRCEALDWMRTYWGGMIGEGATSFWEAYDPRWPKQDFHAHLEADNKTGYYVSLAHGWSGGPTAWLMEQVLGIQPTAAGFHTVSIRPDLSGLQWARGAEPTPRGLIRVDVQRDSVRITLPPQTTATVSLPFAANRGQISQNGSVVSAAAAEDGSRSLVNLSRPGEYTFTTSTKGVSQ